MFRSTLISLVMLVLTSAPSLAQDAQLQGQFLNRILNASNSVSAETARQVYGECTVLGQELAQLQGLDDLQRLYLEAEISSCLSYAMNNGKFSDETGDQCSHHLTFATKLSQVIEGGVGKPGYAGPLMETLGQRLQRATEIGPQLGCSRDYTVFAPAIAIAKANSLPPPPPADVALMGEVGNVKYEITPENAREMQNKCLAFRRQIATTPGLSPAEQFFVEGTIEDCVARAKITGGYTDELGDACAHHFRFAQAFAAGAAAAKNEPEHVDRLLLILQGELEIAQRQGPDMGCKQDYSSLTSQ